MAARMTHDGRPLLGWPAEPGLAAALSLGFLVVFYVVYGAADAISARVPWSIAVALPLDAWFPFVPTPWAAVYLSMDLLLLLCPLALRSRHELRPLFGVLVLETIVAGACFVAFPIHTGPGAPDGWHGWSFAIADALN